MDLAFLMEKLGGSFWREIKYIFERLVEMSHGPCLDFILQNYIESDGLTSRLRAISENAIDIHGR